MTAPNEALARFFSHVPLHPAGTESIALEDAAQRVLACEAVADADYPAASRSAMDGFALAAAQTPGTFAFSDDVLMERPPERRLQRGTAARIPTGGVLPPGADAVVPIEAATFNDDGVTVDAIAAGENVIAGGSDMRRGEGVIAAGTRLSGRHLGVLATLGAVPVNVYRRPIVGVFSTGDELIAVDAAPVEGGVRDSNRYSVAASLRAMGAAVRHYPTASDDDGACERVLRLALRECDAVAVSGGSSVGARDRLPSAVAALGDPGVVVHGLKIKPGKPALLGASGGKPIIGLPGNPASALLVLEAVAAPIVAALVGAPAPRSRTRALLDAPLRVRRSWSTYVPVRLRHEGETPAAHPLALQSFSVSLAARADGYVVVQPDDDPPAAGTPVIVYGFLGG